jgi:hypothetical protein
MAGVIQRIQVLRKGAPKALTSAQIERFDHDGVLLPIRGVSKEVAEGARVKIESMEKAENISASNLCLNGHLIYKWQHDLATNPRICDMIEDLIGPNFFIWKCQLWIKEQDSDSYVGWHQDANYWGLEPPDCVNVWMALTNVTEEHGPMELLRGSHVEPLLPHADLYEANNLLTRGQVIPSLEADPGPDPARTISAVLQPGEMSIHHLCTAHGGGPNRGDDRRIGFNVTYAASHVRSVRKGGKFGHLVRGEWDPDTDMTADPAPTSDNPTEAEMKNYRAKQDGTAESIMEGADLDAFTRVSEERVGRNLPKHVDAAKIDPSRTSLASGLLKSAE